MNKGKLGETIFILVLIAGLFAFVIGSFSYTVELRIIPLLSGLIGIPLLATLLIGRSLPALRWQPDGTDEAAPSILAKNEDDDDADGEESAGAALKIMTYMIGLWVAVVIAGLTLSLPVFIAIFLIFEARVRPHNALISSLIAIAIVVIGLKALGIDPWAGIMPEVIPGYVGGSMMPPL